MHKRQRRGAPALALLALSAGGGILTTGCGSTSSNSSTAHVRGVNFAASAPLAATDDVLVNGAALGGDLAFGQVSTYNYIGSGSSTFSFTTTAILPTNVTIPPRPALSLSNGNYYTAYLIGRPDVPDIRPAVADPRFLQTVVTGDRGAAANYAATPYADPPSGQANVRILNGAADAGPVDVLVNGSVAFAGVTYPALPLPDAGDVTTGRAVTPATAYQAVPGGTISIQVNVTGKSTVLVPATNVSVSSGNVYTLVVTEPTNAPIYGLSTVSDQH